MCMLPSWQQARKASPVVEIQDPKEMKKLLKTTPNVLCLFVKGGGAARELRRVVALTAEQVRGVGSIVYVDCSGYVLPVSCARLISAAWSFLWGMVQLLVCSVLYG